MFPSFPARISDMRNRFSALSQVTALKICLTQECVRQDVDQFQMSISLIPAINLRRKLPRQK